MDKVNEFITGDQKVFLLLGESGAGKSTFNRQLERDMWQKYQEGGLIPLYINLPAIDKPEKDMITKQLRKALFTEPQIKELKDHRQFILICDGYDESHQTHNLYTDNRLNEPGEWQAKMLISCRTEYLGGDYLSRFQPGDRNMTLESTLLLEAVIAPFSAKQIDEYIDRYVAINQPQCEAKKYKQALEQVPSLNDLVTNPFLMYLSLEVLSGMMDAGQGPSTTRITKVALYDHFVKHWLERGKKRLGEKTMSKQTRAMFARLSDEGFTKNGVNFLKKLSVAIYKEQDGHPMIEYSRYKDEGSWKQEFFAGEDSQLLREACPLKRRGNRHWFIHRSILEYGLTLAVFDPQELKEKSPSQPPSNRRGSTSSAMSFEVRGCASERGASENGQGSNPDINSPLVRRSFVNEPSLLQFLEERSQQEPVFRQQLLDYIEYSKQDKKWRTAAANAITILIRAGVEFRFADLLGIQIPGADLTNGVFDSSDLQGADLRKVNLRNAWLQGANLSKSRMAGVQFGELPSLQLDRTVSSCTYSPNGGSFAVGLSDGTISMYATSNWKKSWTSNDHNHDVVGVAFSPTGDQIVSGSLDATVRLWDPVTGQCSLTFLNPTGPVSCVAYSTKGDSVASGDFEKTVRIWNVKNGGCIRELFDHTDTISKVVYSPDKVSIASCSYDGTVRLWSVTTGVCHRTLRGHDRDVASIAFSPQGYLLASAGGDMVRIWNVDTGECRHMLTGHSADVECITFSPDGDRLASGSWDKTLRLWNVQTGKLVRTLSCSDKVRSLAYSPRGDQVASGSHDNTVQLWDVSTGERSRTLTGDAQTVMKIRDSTEGDHIASASQDGTARLRDMGAGTSRAVSNSHSNSVSRILYLSKRHQIASFGEDKTIRIWDIKTGACLQTLPGQADLTSSFIYFPQGDRIVSWVQATLRLWDVKSMACCQTFEGHTGDVRNVDFSLQKGQVASASEDGTVQLWDTATGARKVLAGHDGYVNVVTYSPQGDEIASGGWDHTVRLWNVKTEKCQYTLTGHKGDITCIVYSPNGKTVASGCKDGEVRLWSAETGVCGRSIRHAASVSRMVFSPQGNQLASGSDDCIVKLLEVETGKCSQTVIGHGTIVKTIQFLQEGDLILSQSDKGEARLWNVETGDDLWTHDTSMPVNDQPTTSDVAWIGIDSFVTGGRDGSVRMWDVKEDGQSRVRMRWRSTTGQLTAEDACIQDVDGLSHANRRLLKQRGAVGEPNNRLREAGRKLAIMGNVASKFMAAARKERSASSSSALSAAPSEQ